MYNLTSINAVQFQNLLNAIGQSGGGTDITEQLEAINTTLQNLQIQFSALAENVSLSHIEGLTATNVQEGISELNSSLSASGITLKYSDIFSQSYNVGIYKFGKVCIANLLFINITTIPQSENILKDIIPQEYRPKADFYGSVTNIDKTVTVPLIARSDGKIMVPNYPVTQQAYYYGQIVWLTS